MVCELKNEKKKEREKINSLTSVQFRMTVSFVMRKKKNGKIKKKKNVGVEGAKSAAEGENHKLILAAWLQCLPN